VSALYGISHAATSKLNSTKNHCGVSNPSSYFSLVYIKSMTGNAVLFKDVLYACHVTFKLVHQVAVVVMVGI
jgi:hypothetical protein